MTTRGMIKVVTRLVMYLADSPQRNENCSMKSQNSNVFCVHCMANRSNCLCVPSHLDNKVTPIEIRNVAKARMQFNELNQATTKTERDEIEVEYGIKPRLIGDVYHENPFYRLNDKYGFDIFIDSPVDPFHVIIIGILPTSVDLINSMLDEDKIEMLGSELQRMKTESKDIPDWSTKNYWNGDQWMKFFSTMPYVYGNIINMNNSREAVLI